jgi:hypothetical protein
MAEQWTVTNPNKGPKQIIQQFVDDVFPGRKAMPDDGKWYAYDYRGTFKLVDGTRTYRITCDRYGKYVIESL